MAKPKIKKPKSSYHPHRKKKPRSSPGHSSATQRPSWRFEIIDNDGPWPWNDVNVVRFAEELSPFESQTWAEIRNRNHHLVDVGGCSTEAQTRLIELNQDDTDQLMSLRLGGRGRVFGIMDQAVFRVLWYDPRHEVYPSTKK